VSTNPKVWFVDDLPENLRRFREAQDPYFAVETFNSTTDVMNRIRNNDYPDALLCDIFFFESEARAREVEEQVQRLAEELKKKASEIGVDHDKHTAGIKLMEDIFNYFDGKPPPFPMYAYTSKGPLLLNEREWQEIAKYGAEILLKGRVTPEIERNEILGDIALQKSKNSRIGRLGAGFSYPEFTWRIISGLAGGVLGLVIGKFFLS